MAWIVKKTVQPRPHTCRKPLSFACILAGIDYGSIWQCDSCQKCWELFKGRDGSCWREVN